MINMKCLKCNKKIKNINNKGALYSLTEGYCNDCAEQIKNKDLQLLQDIKENKDISKYLD